MEEASTTAAAAQQQQLQDMTAAASLSLADSYSVDENYAEAIDAYAAAISVVRASEVALHLRALSHRSAAFFHLKRYPEALDDANQALELLSKGPPPAGLRSGESEMCHKRSGLAAFQMQHYLPAKEALQKAAQLASLNNTTTTTTTTTTNNNPSNASSLYQEWIQKCDEQLHPAPPPVAETKPSATTNSTVASPTPTAAAATSSSPALKEAPTARAEPAPALQPTVAPPAPISTTTTNKRPTMPKYQYYQSDNVMTISILEANVQQADLTVDLETKRLTVIVTKGGVPFTVIAGTLYAEINVEKSKVVLKDEKVLLKLRKVDSLEWHELFGKAEDSPPKKTAKTKPASEEAVPLVKDTKNRAYSSHRDWDAIEKNVIEDEKNEKPEGDEAMNKLFKQIYAGASEETQRAMVKSYQTSGGTVLSTNWDEVSKKDYEQERTAPNGMEWKNWEGKKLPMKDDDENK
jgi:tetratricopeptide (TPR) repeat protein